MPAVSLEFGVFRTLPQEDVGRGSKLLWALPVLLAEPRHTLGILLVFELSLVESIASLTCWSRTTVCLCGMGSWSGLLGLVTLWTKLSCDSLMQTPVRFLHKRLWAVEISDSFREGIIFPPSTEVPIWKLCKSKQYSIDKSHVEHWTVTGVLFKTRQDPGVPRFSQSFNKTFLYLNQNNPFCIECSVFTFLSCTFYVGENVYKNGFVILMCITYLWFTFKWFLWICRFLT